MRILHQCAAATFAHGNENQCHGIARVADSACQQQLVPRRGGLKVSSKDGKFRKIACISLVVLSLVAFATFLMAGKATLLPLTGAIFTTVSNGSAVHANIYSSKLDVYLDGGPGPGAPQK